MSYIEDKLNLFDDIYTLKNVDKDLYKDFLSASLEEYRKEFMSLIPIEQDRNMSMYTKPEYYDGFNRCLQELLSKIKQKGL